MSQQAIGKRYAKALLQIANNDKHIKSFQQDLMAIASEVMHNQDLQVLFANPKIKKSDKQAVISNLVEKMQLNNYVGNLIKLLVDKKRIDLLQDISLSFDALANEKMETTTGRLIVAEKIDAGQLKAIEKQLSDFTKKKVNIKTTVDPSIIGGAIAFVESLQFDGSIRNRLEQMKKVIIEE